MTLQRLIDYDFFTYLVIAAIILSIISLIIIATIIYGSKNKQYRHKTIISIGLFLLSLSLVFYYYYPIVLKFQKPVSQDYEIFVYISRPNATGGITEKRYELSSKEYSKVIDTLGNVSLSRQIIDWNKSVHDSIQYEIRIIPITRELNGMYLNEMHLYANSGSKYKSYIIALKDGRKQTYQIIDKAEIKKLISELENLTDLIQ